MPVAAIQRRRSKPLSRHSGLTLSVTTKGTLIRRDIGLLRKISERNTLTINVTITTLSRNLSRMLEGRAPRPAKRLETVRALTEAGLRTGIFIMPVVPGITDSPESLEALVAASDRAGASYVAYQVLFLRGSAKKEFYPFLDAHFPRLAPRLKRIYGANVYYSADYRAGIDKLMRGLLRTYGLMPRSGSWKDGRTGSGRGRSATIEKIIGESQLPLGF